MIDIKTVNDAIVELEAGTASYANCEKLAMLYIVKDHLCKENKTAEQRTENAENKPRSQTAILLPSYLLYIETKKQYQQGNISKEKVLKTLDYLLNEIKELIKKLYSNTDVPEERERITRLINEINVGII